MFASSAFVSILQATIMSILNYLIFFVSFSYSRNAEARQSVSDILDKIFDKKRYDARLRPNYEGEITE